MFAMRWPVCTLQFPRRKAPARHLRQQPLAASNCRCLLRWLGKIAQAQARWCGGALTGGPVAPGVGNQTLAGPTGREAVGPVPRSPAPRPGQAMPTMGSARAQNHNAHAQGGADLSTNLIVRRGEKIKLGVSGGDRAALRPAQGLRWGEDKPTQLKT